MFHFSDGNNASLGGSLKHTCPFGPAYLIAISTLINPYAVSVTSLVPTLSSDELRQTASLTWLSSQGTVMMTFTSLDHNFPKIS